MPKFRKKPVVIEARQWDGSAPGATPIIDWILSNGPRSARLVDFERDGIAAYRIAIDTLEGTMQASPGDFIIRGVQDEFYPCNPEIFADTYEPAE